MRETKYIQGYGYVTKGEGIVSDIALAAGKKVATAVGDRIGTAIANKIVARNKKPLPDKVKEAIYKSL